MMFNIFGKMQEINEIMTHSGPDGLDYCESVNICHDLVTTLLGHTFEMDQSESIL